MKERYYTMPLPRRQQKQKDGEQRTMGQDNQKTILKIVKEPHDKEHLFACLNIAAADAALKNIGPSAFAMWYYFARNNETYERWELSSKDVENKIGLTRGIYNRAIHTLIEKGYLVPQQNEKNGVANEWIFYEVPPAGKANGARGDTLNENKSTLYQNNTSLELKYNKSLTERKQGLNENKSTNITDNTLQNKDKTLYGGAPLPLYRGAPPKQKKQKCDIDFSFLENEELLPYEKV